MDIMPSFFDGLWESYTEACTIVDPEGLSLGIQDKPYTIVKNYDNYDWIELPLRIRRAAETLGYNEDLWEEDKEPESSNKSWSELTPVEQSAAEVMGYSQEKWDGDEEPKKKLNPAIEYDEDAYWKDLPQAIKDAAKVLGYTEKLWNNDKEPATCQKEWDKLTDKEMDAAETLGYDKEKWDDDDKDEEEEEEKAKAAAEAAKGDNKDDGILATEKTTTPKTSVAPDGTIVEEDVTDEKVTLAILHVAPDGGEAGQESAPPTQEELDAARVKATSDEDGRRSATVVVETDKGEMKEIVLTNEKPKQKKRWIPRMLPRKNGLSWKEKRELKKKQKSMATSDQENSKLSSPSRSLSFSTMPKTQATTLTPTRSPMQKNASNSTASSSPRSISPFSLGKRQQQQEQQLADEPGLQLIPLSPRSGSHVECLYSSEKPTKRTYQPVEEDDVIEEAEEEEPRYWL